MWQKLFRTGAPSHLLHRERLVSWVLEPQLRWVAVHGVPALGRSTLLRQARDRALAEQAPGSAPAFRMLECSDHFATPGVLAREIRRLYETGAEEGPVTIALDDFDWAFTPQTITDIVALLEQHPRLRIVTVTVWAPSTGCGGEDGPVFVPSGPEGRPSTADGYSEIGPAQLYFTFEETLELCDRYLESEPTTEAARGIAESVWQLARRAALTTAFLIEQHIETGSAGGAIAQLTARVPAVFIEEVMGRLPARLIGDSLVDALRELSLMPVFTHEWVARFDAPQREALQLVLGTDYAALMFAPEGKSGADFVWELGWWRPFMSFNEQRRAERIDLAERLAAAGPELALDELWQRLLLRDWARAEQLLAGRFALAFESLPPSMIADLVKQRIDGSAHPLTTALQCLLGLREGLDDSRMMAGLKTVLCVRRAPNAGPVDPREGLHALTVSVVQAEIAAGLGGDSADGPALRRALQAFERTSQQAADPRITASPDLGDLGYHLAELGLRLGRIDVPERVLAMIPAQASRDVERQMLEDALGAIAGEDLGSHYEGSLLPRRWRALGIDPAELIGETGQWQQLDRGEVEACAVGALAQFATRRRPGRRAQTAVGIPPIAGLVAMLLTDRVAEARRVFDAHFPSYASTRRSPDDLREWLHRLICLAEGRLAAAAPLSDGQPQSEIGRSADAFYDYARRLGECKASFPVPPRDGELIRFSGVRLAAEAAQMYDAGQHGAAKVRVDAALSACGVDALRFGLRLVHREHAEWLVAAAGPESGLGELWADGARAGAGLVRQRSRVKLTSREQSVLQRIAAGASLEAIAESSYVSLSTVRSQLRTAMQKLGVAGRTRQEAVREAQRLGLLEPSSRR